MATSTEYTQSALLAAYAAFVNSADGKLILNDLNLYAKQEAENPVVRCGRHDVVSHIHRQGRRNEESTPVPVKRGRASTTGQVTETEQE
jgi:hypothetical protein